MTDSDPLEEIPESLWSFVDQCGSADTAKAALMKMGQDEMAKLFREFMQARADLAFELVETGRAEGRSEDALDDLAQSVLLEGKDAYRQVFRGERSLPPQSISHRVLGVLSLFDEVYMDRFGAEIFEELED